MNKEETTNKITELLEQHCLLKTTITNCEASELEACSHCLAAFLVSAGATIPTQCQKCRHGTPQGRTVLCSKSQKYMKADDFCSYGE